MRNRRTFLAAAGAALVLGCRTSSGRTGAVRAGRYGSQLDELLLEKMRAAHVPGMSFAIVRQGRLVRTAGLGLADAELQRPMQPDTLINIASVTKTITCTAAMQLCERGIFHLADDVNGYLPFAVRNPRYPDEPITFQQLLTHTSSIADGPAYFRSYACGDPQVSLRNWVQSYFDVKVAATDTGKHWHDWKPGARYAYSNVAFGLLGLLVEILSGMPYMDCVRRRVFEPLDMSRSRFVLAGMDPAAHATPYSYEAPGQTAERVLVRPGWRPPARVSKDGALIPHCLYSFATPPDGLVRTSSAELVNLLLAYMNGGEWHGRRILAATTVKEIVSRQPVGDSAADSQVAARVQGLAWYRQRKLGPGLIWGHSGDDPGVVTLMAFRPRDRSGLVVLTNSSEGAHVAIELARQVFAGDEALSGAS